MTGIFNSDDFPKIGLSRKEVLDSRWKSRRFVTKYDFDYRNFNKLAFVSKVCEILKSEGICLAKLSSVLSDNEFINLGEMFGVLIKENENDAIVNPYISKEFILNVVTNYSGGSSENAKPFLNTHLTLHTECSKRTAPNQPSYLMFMCLAPGTNSFSETVLIPTENIISELSESDKEILKNTYYLDGETPFLRDEDDSEVFSFRDFHPHPMQWRCEHGESTVTIQQVNEVLARMMLAMYKKENCSTIEWEKNLLMIMDNKKFFHGKKSSANCETVEEARHIKRLRII